MDWEERQTTLSPPAAGDAHARRDEGAGQFLPGTIVGDRYRMIGLLGRGGMGEVYRADDLKLGQPVALKFLPPDVEHDPDRLARFLNEVRSSLRVTHPNVCRVFDVSQLDGRHFLSMEYVDGEDLASLLRRIGRLPEDKAIEIARQLCAGLSAAHDAGVLHRDIKPANIMIDGRGRAKITDFGLAGAVAGLEGVEARAGTPQYMAPEQVEGAALSTRTDLYALGLVLYELFTGKRALTAETQEDCRQRSTTPTSPTSHVSGLDPLVERAVLRCLEPDPAKRPQSAAALAASLPGGDPLAMAIAAGDTPSPEMVAAAGAEVGITTKMATVLLGVALVGLTTLGLLAGRLAIYTIGAPVKSPEVMIEHARQILADAGVRGPVADSAWGLYLNQPYFNSPREPVRNGRDPALTYGVVFWYREGPVRLQRWLFTNPYLLTTVQNYDPKLFYSGESLMYFDGEGRLADLTMVAPEHPSEPQASVEPAWPVLFKAAGLDQATWVPVNSEWLSWVHGDRRYAWTPRSPQPVPAVRIEASSVGRQPTSFRLILPWSTSERDAGTWRSAEKQAGDLIAVLLLAALVVGSVLMARRNWRLDRADRAGALRVALVVGGLTEIAWLADDHHVPSIWEAYLVMTGTSWAMFAGAVAGAFYLALEPHVRRTWPSLLVSWSRLLAGDVWNPLVARDVLIGAAVVGVTSSLNMAGMHLAHRLTGVLPLLDTSPRPFLGGRFLVSHVANNVMWFVFLTLSVLLLYYVVRLIVRSEWATVLVCGALVSLPLSGALGGGAEIVRLPSEFIFSAAMFVLLSRVGLVASLSASLLNALLVTFPITWPMSYWYSSAGMLGAALVATVVITAYRIVVRAQVRTGAG